MHFSPYFLVGDISAKVHILRKTFFIVVAKSTDVCQRWAKVIISVVQFKILQTFKSCIGAMDINTKIIANKETDHLELILPLKQHYCPNLVQIYQELCVLEKHVSHKRKKNSQGNFSWYVSFKLACCQTNKQKYLCFSFSKYNSESEWFSHKSHFEPTFPEKCK